MSAPRLPAPLLIKPVHPAPRPAAPPAPPPRTRIFDHLEGTPEDRPLSNVAHAMHASAWWSRVPERDEPAAVAGEVEVTVAYKTKCQEAV